jgi:hypothetical protein
MKLVTTTAMIEYIHQTIVNLELPKIERERIGISIDAIRKKLIPTFFNDGLKEILVFGSFE